MKMDWPLFSEHVVHHLEQCRKEKRELEEQNKLLANKLTQLQLGKLTKQKKEREKKIKTQAPVVTAEAIQQPQLPVNSTIATTGATAPAIYVYLDPRPELSPT